MAALKVTITGYNNVWKQDTIRYLSSKKSRNITEGQVGNYYYGRIIIMWNNGHTEGNSYRTSLCMEAEYS